MGLSLLDKEASQANLIKEIERLSERVAVLERAAWTGTPESFGIRARVYNNDNLTIPDDTLTALTLNSEREDTNSIHSTSVNTARLTCFKTGWHIISATADFLSNSTGIRSIYIRLNGTDIIATDTRNAVDGANTRMEITTMYYLSAGDFVGALVYQNSGGDLDIYYGAKYSPEFMMVRVA